MKGLRGALGFMTILPVGKELDWQGSRMLPWFPIVGLIVGVLWAGFDWLAGFVFPMTLRTALAVLFVVVLTGALHLDGLADTADGLLSHRGRDAALEIMKDSHIGTWGVLAVVLVLGLKTLALVQIAASEQRFFALLLIPAYGRLSMLPAIWLIPYGRGDEGLGHKLFQDRKSLSWIPGACVVTILSTLMGLTGLLKLCVPFCGVVLLVISYYKTRLGCVTGDMLGALSEITETVLLVVLASTLA
jgi:adenosylcobinamide-GDP ribazoletransferase